MNPDKLNDKQTRAVRTTNKPILIIAGPGTGKTRVLTHRIAYLIEQGTVKPEQIIALTFTNKAAKEIKERISQLLATGYQLPAIHTFHSLAYKLLSKQDEEITLISEQEKRRIIKEIQEGLGKHSPLWNLTPKELALKISNHNIRKHDPRDKNQESSKDNSLAHLIDQYKERKQTLGLLDYDDLLIKAYRLLKQPSDYRLPITNYVLVDEFQDTNPIQFEITKQLLGDSNNIFVIGDPQQSIYSFRGADSRAFDNFRKDFPDFEEIALDTNYRSTQALIDASTKLFAHEKQLFATSYMLPSKNTNKYTEDKIPTSEIQLITTLNEFTEADWITNKISSIMGGLDLNQASDFQKTKQDKKARFSDFAVIYRVHGLNRVLQQKFRESGIPTQIVGGGSLYEQNDIAFVILVLKFINSQTQENFLKIARSPIIKLSATTIDKLNRISGHKQPTTPAHRNFSEGGNYQLPTTQSGNLGNLVTNLNSLTYKDRTVKLSVLIQEIIDVFDIHKRVEDNPAKLLNLNEFTSTCLRFDKFEDSLNKFLEYFEKLSESDFYDEKADKVTMLTMHAAKGLEFKYVIIAGFEDGLIPFTKKDTKLDEEKRLLYVAMTRAKQGLYLLYTQNRNREEIKISRFFSLLEEKIDSVEDDAIRRIRKQEARKRQKKSQIRMFG